MTRPRKRVLVLSTLWPNAAAPRFGTFVASSIEALAKQTHWEPVVLNPIGLPPLALGRYGDLRRALEAEPTRTEPVDLHRFRFPLIPRWGARRNPSAIAKAALPLARTLHEEAPFDLVDAQFFYPDGPAAFRLAEALGLPLSIKARGADIHYWGQRPWALASMREAADGAAGLLAVSEPLADDMRALGLNKPGITIHHTGLDRDRFRPLSHDGIRRRLAEALDLPLSGPAPLLVSVGALIERKGQRFAIEALAQLPDIRLLLLGSGPEEAKLRALAKALGVADRVLFAGAVDHDLLPLVLSAADAMVLPSKSEGIANAWIEALACGTPLVVTDVGGIREVLRPEAGVLIDRSTDGVVEGVREVLLRPTDRMAVAETVSRFDWSENARQLADHYDRLTA